MGRRVRAGVGGSLLLLALSAPGAAADGASDAELREALEGFEDEPALEHAPGEPEERFWDLSGSAELSGSVNYLRHRSAIGSDGTPKNYTGLSRLRHRLNLQLDLSLPRDWKARVAGFAFYDAAYRIRGRGGFTGDVRSQYESEYDFQEVWVLGRLFEDVDVKLGRQIVNWGRSDTIRILDILNPLDLREPGRADIEDLRRPVTMARVDTFLGNWSLTAVAVPELRFSQNPVPGSDFFPAATSLPERPPDESFDNTGWAGSLTGLFQGWDVSLQAARYWDDQPHAVGAPGAPTHFEHARLWMVGSGGNTTAGAWLFKYELGFFDGLEFFAATDSKSRLDALAGVEYYGIDDTAIAVEAASRHLFDYQPGMGLTPDFAERNAEEIALRYTADFLNARLHATILGVLFGWRAQQGSAVRLSLDYDLRDALVLSAGMVLYQSGNGPFVGSWSRNDRFIFGVEYSF